MRKLSVLTIAVALVLQAHADEGMWTLCNLPQQVYQAMQAEGFQLPYDALYKSNDAIKNSVVNFSGFCSGVVVSPDGLVFTNHHCGFEAIRSHSTVEHDYMLNGFVAQNYEEELPNKDMFVSFMVSQQDITDKLTQLGIDQRDKEAKSALIDSLQNALTQEAKAQDSTLHVDIDAFYEGNRWYATTYQDFTDLRLVFALPKSMGKFGGETDNWMWPRQTCDFSVFRIYADKNNRPAAYSKDNRPYHPQHWAPVSLKGYRDGDFSMTIGYPGSTNRYLSHYGIKLRRDAENAPRAQVRGIKQEVMQRHMRASEAVRIKYDSKFAQSANYWKNSIGMNKCIDSIGLIAQKERYEQRIQQWQDTTLIAGHRVDFDALQRLYNRYEALRYVQTMWSETFTRRSNIELNVRALKLYNGMEAKGPQGHPRKAYNEFEDNSKEWDAATDKEMLATLLENYRKHVDRQWLPAFYHIIDTRYNGNCARYVDDLYTKSLIMRPGAKLYFNRKAYKKDPGVSYGIDVMDVYANLEEQSAGLQDSIAQQEKYLCAAKLRMEEDQPHYSDANFTMRLSYGQVGGFELGGRPSGYYTTAASMVEKMRRGLEGVVDYQTQPIMKQILSAHDFGQYTDSVSRQLNLCFLTNNDITGGNSGSPIFNGRGELMGLAFDGNWDSLSSDINFDKRLARCIGVDIRYVLYMMQEWGHADRLLREINAR